jgi:hypothetical protein
VEENKDGAHATAARLSRFGQRDGGAPPFLDSFSMTPFHLHTAHAPGTPCA